MAVDDYVVDRLIPDDPAFVRHANAAEPRLSATVVQTVGTKKCDGFLMAVVD